MNFNLSKRSSRSLRSRNSGIALVSVLWLVLLLSGLAATVAYVARVEALLTRRAFDLARLQAAADAAVVSTIANLSDVQVSGGLQVGVTQKFHFNDIPVTVVVSSESGRIDLHSAEPELVLAYLRSRGLTPDVTTSMMNALRSGPEVRDISDLGQLDGWRDQKLDCWSRDFTVFSGARSVTASDASPSVLAALSWLATHGTEGTSATNLATTPTFSQTRSPFGEVIRIDTQATAAEARAASDWIGRVTGDPTRPALTLRWDRGLVYGQNCR
jgi:hypothetical protein